MFGSPGTRVDIVRNVINLVAVHWAADYLIGIPLKTKATPKGMFTEQEVYDIFSLLFTCVFINVLPEHGWSLRTQAKQFGDVINSLIEKSLNEASPRTAAVSLFPLTVVWTEKDPDLDVRSVEPDCGPIQRRLEHYLAYG